MMREENVRRNCAFVSALTELLASEPDAQLRDLIRRAEALALRKLEQRKVALAYEAHEED